MDYVEAGLLILLVAAGSIIVADLFRRAGLTMLMASRMRG